MCSTRKERPITKIPVIRLQNTITELIIFPVCSVNSKSNTAGQSLLAIEDKLTDITRSVESFYVCLCLL